MSNIHFLERVYSTYNAGTVLGKNMAKTFNQEDRWRRFFLGICHVIPTTALRHLVEVAYKELQFREHNPQSKALAVLQAKKKLVSNRGN